ncbi:hypothetical protein DWY98_03715 [Thomasclavelia ramosa]|nr:hypothetical protein DWY98_03715 [Thomasclavelia ramosa]
MGKEQYSIVQKYYLYAIHFTVLYKICKYNELLNKRAQGSGEEITLLCSLSSKANGKGKPCSIVQLLEL